MSVSPSKSLLSGALFGSALTVAGMFSPGVIIGQLRLENFHMLKTFLMASATSGYVYSSISLFQILMLISFSIFIILAQKMNVTSCKPRLPNSIGLFSKYDGNIVGGTLLGVGLALTGACPGTVVPQVATGVASGPLVLAGGILGGALYSRFGQHLQRKVFTKTELENPTVHETLGITRNQGIAFFVTLCSFATAISGYYDPSTTPLLIPAVSGGLLIGLSQGASLFLTGNTLGISSAYEQLGDIFWWAEKSLFEPSIKTSPPKITSNILFALGTTAGSFAISKLIDLPQDVSIPISSFRALSGGAIMIFGSRLAGGCTSGHGISGMSQLSISSIVSVAAMFAGGIGLTFFL